ncbi:helix-turn-helix domain-containing protein [Mucilaginibacter phyllosphaerae]
MNRNYGEIVEIAVRRSGLNISDIASDLNVNRRTLYNWFRQKDLKKQIIYQVGQALRHDFSKQFPELFTAEEFANMYAPKMFTDVSLTCGTDKWKEKYILLLERYNELIEINNP